MLFFRCPFRSFFPPLEVYARNTSRSRKITMQKRLDVRFPSPPARRFSVLFASNIHRQIRPRKGSPDKLLAPCNLLIAFFYLFFLFIPFLRSLRHPCFASIPVRLVFQDSIPDSAKSIVGWSSVLFFYHALPPHLVSCSLFPDSRVFLGRGNVAVFRFGFLRLPLSDLHPLCSFLSAMCFPSNRRRLVCPYTVLFLTLHCLRLFSRCSSFPHPDPRRSRSWQGSIISKRWEFPSFRLDDSRVILFPFLLMLLVCCSFFFPVLLCSQKGIRRPPPAKLQHSLLIFSSGAFSISLS